MRLLINNGLEEVEEIVNCDILFFIVLVILDSGYLLVYVEVIYEEDWEVFDFYYFIKYVLLLIEE